MERHDDPFALLNEWCAEAQRREPALPLAASLATVGADGRPSNRIVMLRDASPEGLDFYTDTRSRKGRELARSPFAALVLYWKSLEWQVRMEGRVEPLPDSALDAYWESRTRDSQVGAWAFEQSSPIASRAAMERAKAAEEARHEGRSVPRPPSLGGYRVTPDWFEFMQIDAGGLHDRIEFRRDEAGGAWTRTRLQP